jgi:hypothetical protein
VASSSGPAFIDRQLTPIKWIGKLRAITLNLFQQIQIATGLEHKVRLGIEGEFALKGDIAPVP